MKKKYERRFFSKSDKLKIISDIKSGRKTIEQVEKEYGISKHYHISRWMMDLAQQEKMMAEVMQQPSPTPIQAPKIDSKATMMVEILQDKVADLIEENRRLKALLDQQIKPSRAK